MRKARAALRTPGVLPRAIAGQRINQRLVESEQVFDPRALVGKPARVLALVDSRIEITVRFAQFGWHEIGIVEVGERGAVVLVQRPRVEHGLHQFNRVNMAPKTAAR